MRTSSPSGIRHDNEVFAARPGYARRVSKQTSKFLSLILRHQPEVAGITLDDAGWTDVALLLAALARAGHALTREELGALVATSDKQRFALSDDGTRIRANQGHSVEVELSLPDTAPPVVLYHGTYAPALASIRAQGLLKGTRHAVHMATEKTTASSVGMRRGAPVILVIRAGDMAAAGFRFQVSANGVWLTEHVPPQFIQFPP